MSTEFDKASFFIIYPNPSYDSKLAGEMNSTSEGLRYL